jgi:hypothetical protein
VSEFRFIGEGIRNRGCEINGACLFPLMHTGKTDCESSRAISQENVSSVLLNQPPISHEKSQSGVWIQRYREWDMEKEMGEQLGLNET